MNSLNFLQTILTFEPINPILPFTMQKGSCRMRNLPIKIKFRYIILTLLTIFILAAVIPYLTHKEVNEDFKKQFAKQSFLSDVTGPERVAYVTENTDALLYRLRMIEEAEDEIIMSTFDFNCDESGKDIMSALLHAADRDVHVRVIVDGFSGLLDMRGDPYFQALASHENIELKRYNPINFLKPWTLQARLHDKYLIIDDSIYLLGGRNTMDLFLGDYSEAKNLDRELFVYTPHQTDNTLTSLKQLREYFERVWALPESKSYRCDKPSNEVQAKRTELEERYSNLTVTYPAMLNTWDWNDLTMETGKVTLLTNPIEANNKEPHMWYALTELMKQGKNIKIYTPYIICGKEMYADLEQICNVTDSVDIITNDVASGANPWGCTDYLNQQGKIRATGVKVYEYLNEDSSHTKSYLIDDRLSIIGSFNMDMRSTYLDTELMLAVDCPELNAIIQEEFEHDKTYSRTKMTSAAEIKVNSSADNKSTPEKQATDEYLEGENYHAVTMSAGKKIYYGILRIVIIPIRKFL